MQSFLTHIVGALWHRRLTEFWAIWMSVTATAAIGAAWVVGYPASNVRERDHTSVSRVRRYNWSSSALAPLAVMLVLLAGYIIEAYAWENFADRDDHFFSLGTLKGLPIGLRIWPGQGRFFPLAFQEFNLIRHFTTSVVGYHTLLLIQLSMVCCLLLLLDGELSIAARATLAAVMLILPGTIINFTELVTPDRDLVFFLILLVLFVKLFEKRQSTVWAVAAIVSAQTMIYYKETAFLILLGFGIARIALRCWRTDRPGLDLNRLWTKESRLDLCFIVVALLFLPFYLFEMMPHPGTLYGSRDIVSLAATLVYYMKLDLPVWCLLLVFLRRAYLILRHRSTPVLLWDGLAFGAILYFFAYLWLHLTSAFDLAPADLIALLYVGRFTVLSWPEMRVPSKVAVSALAAVILVQALSFSAFILFERKNVILAKAEVADVIVARYHSGTGAADRLFFPFTDPYQLTEFASYLSYRGVPIEGDTSQPTESRKITLLATRDVTKDGPCVDYMDLICHVGTEFRPNDLIIELPDDQESAGAMSPYRNRGALLFSEGPHPRILQRLIPFADFFRMVSVQFKFKPIPSRFLQSSIMLNQDLQESALCRRCQSGETAPR